MLRFGINPPIEGWRDHAHQIEWAAAVADAGIDHVFVADHVSFRSGQGMDGLIQVASLLSLNGRLDAFVGVYLLALRHPVAVARQIATIAEYAPGRLIFGVGVGGDDRNEYAAVGADAGTRGRRTDEALQCLGPLLKGEAVSHHGEFFEFDQARILPSPDPPVPILIGGRSEAAMRRTAEYAEGWLAAWVTPQRFADSLEQIDELAGVPRAWQHGYQGWIGSGSNRSEARQRLAATMEGFYATPYEKFEQYTQGRFSRRTLLPSSNRSSRGVVKIFNLTPVAGSPDEAIATVAGVKQLLS